MAKQREINIKNRKAEYEYFFVERYEAGIVLLGTEIKSIRDGNANIKEAYCFMRNGELFVRNMHISEYKHGTINNHDPIRVRKLLLNKRELKKLDRKIREKGSTIVPTRLFINERGFAKIEVALARGKKSYDKRNTIKDRENKRDLQRIQKGLR